MAQSVLHHKKVTIKVLFSVLLKHKVIILAALLSVTLGTVLFVRQLDDIYESYTTIVIEKRGSHLNELMNIGGRSLDFYQGILNSRTFIELVADSLLADSTLMIESSLSRSTLKKLIRTNLTLRPTQYAEFLRLNARAPSSNLAFKLALFGTQLFRARCTAVETDESRRAVDEIEKQLIIIRGKLEQAEHDYRRYVEETGDLLEGSTQELSTLQETYSKNLAQLGVKEADLAAEKKLLHSLEQKIEPTTQSNSAEFRKLRSQLKELEKERMRLENLGIQLGSFSAIDRDITDIEKRLLQLKTTTGISTVNNRMIQQWQTLRKSVIAKEAELDLFKKRLQMYRRSIKNYKKKNPNILSESLELLRLKRSKETLEKVYSFLLEKAEEERIKYASSGAGIKIVDTPTKPGSPLPKNEERYYAISFLLGLFLGIGTALAIDFFDTTIKSITDIEEYLQLPVLGTIPHISSPRQNHIKLERHSHASKQKRTVTTYPGMLLEFDTLDALISEAYRTLRTNLSFSNPDKPLSTIALSSTGPGEGKSITTINLATAFAQLGKRTVIIDSDLRRPVIHRLFKKERVPGLSDIVIGSHQSTDAIHATDTPNLFIITAGTFTPNPAELIGSKKMAEFIEQLKNEFDLLLFDTPPILAVTDMSLLAAHLDRILLVIKAGKTEGEVAARAVQNLSQIGISLSGIVLNDVDTPYTYKSYGYENYLTENNGD